MGMRWRRADTCAALFSFFIFAIKFSASRVLKDSLPVSRSVRIRVSFIVVIFSYCFQKTAQVTAKSRGHKVFLYFLCLLQKYGFFFICKLLLSIYILPSSSFASFIKYKDAEVQKNR